MDVQLSSRQPWLFEEFFAGGTTVDGLRTALREAFPNLAALEDIAIERGIVRMRMNVTNAVIRVARRAS